MNKRKFFLLPICLLLLGACSLNQHESKESKGASEPEASVPEASEPSQSSEECEHEFGDWTISMIPTCTEVGEETRICSVCGATEKRDVAALGHNWDDGVVTRVATVEEKGSKTFTCQRCQETKVEETDKATGITVTFNQGEHFHVYVYKTQQYATETPVEQYTCYARDENGNAIDFDAEAELQPQVSFKVVCDNGYSVNATNISINGTYKNLKQNPNKADTENPYDDDSIFRITKIQENITVTITPAAGEQAPGYKVTFVTNHCSVKVYVGPKNEEGTNLDTEAIIYARLKDAPYDIGFTTPQLNFEVVCESGYEFVPVITDDKVDFIEGSYNKFQFKNNCYNITKIASDLTITLTATVAA